MIYLGTLDGTVQAHSIEDGSEKWTVETPAAESGRFSASNAVKGAPAVHDGVVFTGNDSGHVYALAADDDTELWHRDLGYVQGGPTLVGETVYIGCGDSLYALAKDDGSTQWMVERNNVGKTASAVSEDTIYLVGGAPEKLEALNANDGSTKWTFEVDLGVYGSSTVGEGTVYVATSFDGLYALDTTDGSEKWNINLSGDPKSPAIADGVLYVGDEDGYLYSVNPENGSIKWRSTCEEGIELTAPSVSDGIVYIASKRHICGFDITDGSEQWRYEIDGNDANRFPPTVAGGTVYGGGYESPFVALR
jgi:outer membrane protein assembly factor BamB